MRNVHGERDESSAIIRLADSVGVVREAHEGKTDYIATEEIAG
jgi:hypothetical protein